MLTMTNQKFKIWNKENSIQNEADKLQIIITKAGITFLAKTAEKLKLKEGAEVTFLQSEEDESRWFLTAAVPGGMVLKKRADGNLQIKAGLLSAAMIKCVGSARMGGVRVRVQAVPEALPKQEGLPAVARRIYLNEVKQK